DNIGCAWIREAIYSFWYGKCSWSNSCYVEVDLLHSYFDIDGDRTRALVQIPYYLSKTGSKITLSQYREFVEELYQKEGIGNYYTIDENNQTFTLPMGEIYGMISKRADAKLSNVTLGTDFIKKIINELAPDTSAIVDISTTPTSYSSAFVAPCSGWYVCNADVTAKRYLYINGVKTGYCLSSSNQPSISVFLGLNDRVYWSGSLSVVNSQTFIPLKGCHYVKPSSSGGGSLDDLFG
ncbi:MAG: hypothetical protein MJ231_06360, partial [bacterium]|nr:hypothetical protein [bacterium]